MKIETAIWQAINERAQEAERRGRRGIEAVTQIVRRGWQEILTVIKRRPDPAAVPGLVRPILQRMAAATEAGIEPVLIEQANWAWESAFAVWEDHLPADLWAVAFQPADDLLEGVEFNFPDGDFPGGRGKDGRRSAAAALGWKGSKGKRKPSISNVADIKGGKAKGGKLPAGKGKKPAKGAKVSKGLASGVKKKATPPPSDILKIIRSRGWKGRMKKWSKKITDYDKVAEQIADGLTRGLKFETIVNRIKGSVQGYAASARRIVRTESARIENVLMERTFETFAEIIIGFQIVNPLDERTRPTHRQRAGKIYWKKGRPNADDRPELPDAPNCRCQYAPLLSQPPPKELKAAVKKWDKWRKRLPEERQDLRTPADKRKATLKAKEKATRKEKAGKGTFKKRPAKGRTQSPPDKKALKQDKGPEKKQEQKPQKVKLTAAEKKQRAQQRVDEINRKIAEQEKIKIEREKAEKEAKQKAAAVPVTDKKKGDITYRTPVSTGFHNELAGELKTIPAGVRNVVEGQHGAKVVSGDLSTSVKPDLKLQSPRGHDPGTKWEMLGGFYAPVEREIVVVEKELSRFSGTLVPQDNIGGVLRHEYGHAVDASGTTTGHGYHSRSKEFETAYAPEREAAKKARDAANLAPPDLTPGAVRWNLLNYFLQDGDAGASEAFAEGFGQAIGKGGCFDMESSGGKAFARAFPNTVAQIKKVIGGMK